MMKSSYKPPFSITTKALNLAVEIAQLVAKVEKGFEYNVMLRKKNRIKTITGTLAIEGNTLDIEKVTALLEGKKVMGAKQEIQEVYAAINAYKHLDDFDPCKINDLLKAHSFMMEGIIKDAGRFRSGNVGVKGGGEVVHIAPPLRVHRLITDLIEWLRTTDVNPLIASSIFHYEFEFIHPFSDGNGRTGRLWQTLILSRYNPSFAYFPIESIVKEKQQAYYDALAVSDEQADSTVFIEFMLECIFEAVSSVKSSVKSSVNTDEIILQYLANNPKATAVQMADFLHITVRAVEKQIAKLKADGKLVRVGSARKGEWEVETSIFQ
jgi:Fic family protein